MPIPLDLIVQSPVAQLWKDAVVYHNWMGQRLSSGVILKCPFCYKKLNMKQNKHESFWIDRTGHEKKWIDFHVNLCDGVSWMEMRKINQWIQAIEGYPFSFGYLLLPPANKVWGKVIFSVACVKNSVYRNGGGLHQCMLGYPPTPLARRPPWQGRPPTQCMLGDTVNKRAVCILLECNLVYI